MKKHRVSFTATVSGSIVVEGDDNPKLASAYVKKNLSFGCWAEGIDGEIEEEEITIHGAMKEEAE